MKILKNLRKFFEEKGYIIKQDMEGFVVYEEYSDMDNERLYTVTPWNKYLVKVYYVNENLEFIADIEDVKKFVNLMLYMEELKQQVD